MGTSKEAGKCLDGLGCPLCGDVIGIDLTYFELFCTNKICQYVITFLEYHNRSGRLGEGMNRFQDELKDLKNEFHDLNNSLEQFQYDRRKMSDQMEKLYQIQLDVKNLKEFKKDVELRRKMVGFDLLEDDDIQT